ncbi:hypothetical protein [Streptomyces antibioticus]|uniref:hypothetical protein n=1 Tax=Streptomyces antibioticus TaxID=1890 RepID=UPI0036F85BAC
MADYEAEIVVGGSTFPCRARLNRWKEHVEAVSSTGRSALAGLEDWDGTIYLEGDTDADIQEAAWAIHEGEEPRLRVDDLEGPFGVVADVDARVVQIQGHGRLERSV